MSGSFPFTKSTATRVVRKYGQCGLTSLPIQRAWATNTRADCTRAKKMSEGASKLKAYLGLAEDVCALIENIARSAAALHEESKVEQRLRARVLTGLALKIDSSFRALIEDVRARRSESMHHLKTMAESFIYFHVVAKDPSDRTAALLYARALHDKIVFFRDNPGYVPGDEITRWQEGRDLFLAEACGSRAEKTKLKAELRRIRQIEQLAKAHGPELGTWYRRVYRQACEPAHLGDLSEFMPPGNPIRPGSPPTAILRAHVAIDYGLHLMLAMIHAINDLNNVGLHFPTEAIEERLRQIRQAT